VKDAFYESFVRRKVKHRGRAVNFFVDTVRLPNGKLATREFVDHPGAVCVVPFKDPKTVVLVRQYRHPVGKTTFEIPAGKLDPGEGPIRCARRELREETGYRAGRIERILGFWPAPAFSNEKMYIYRAEQLKPGPMSPDEDEFIGSVEVPFQEALDWARSGKIQDVKTILGLFACALPARRPRSRRR